MLKVRILTSCDRCGGQAYLPTGESEDHKGRKYIRFAPCPVCEGSGNQPKWIGMDEFTHLLQAQCSHEHIATQGAMHFSAGDVWDDITEVCSDCGAHLK